MLRITSFLLLTTLTIQTSAVLNIPKPVYGVPDGVRYPPPPPDIPPPRPVYGVPDGNRYPPPPPDFPPPPHKEYGVPVLKYGPPKVHFEHGISGPGQHQFSKKFPFGNGGGHSKKLSFFDQIKSHFGLSGGSAQYGVPAPGFRQNPQFEHSVHHFESHGGSGFGGQGHSFGGQGHSFGVKIPGPAYGVPAQSYGPPAPGPAYGPPQQSFVPPQQSFGPPPSPSYGLPIKHHVQSFGVQGGGSFGAGASFGGGHASFNGGHGGHGGHHNGPSFAPPRLVACDGWKPIAGPIGNDNVGHVHIQAHNTNFEHSDDTDHADIITHAGFGGSDFNVIKSQGIELHDNSIGTDSFNIPPSGSYGTPSIGGSIGHSSGGSFGNSFGGGFGSSGSGGSFGSSHSSFGSTGQGSFGSSGRGSFGTLGGSYGPPASGPVHQPSIHLTPANNPYVPPRPATSYGPPPSGNFLVPPTGSYGVPNSGGNGGLAISHGSISGNLKSWPVSGAAPQEPVSFKEPLPQGLIESIGDTVKQYDSLSNSVASAYTSNSGVQIQQSTDLSSGLYSLPLENSPRPFYQAQDIPQFGRQLPLESNFNGHTDCNHGPIQDSYGPPPSGRNYQNQHLGASSEINLVSSYGPPPSGIVDSNGASSSIQEDSVAHASKLRSSTSSGSTSEDDEESNSAENDVVSSETSQSHQSDSFEIPVQGQLGSYQLQFQSANTLEGGNSNAVPHQQLLSEGLLQQILSAIEHPNQSNKIVPQSTYDQHSNHHDVATFLDSPTGRETLAEPNKSK